MDLKEAVKFQNLKDLMLKKQRCGNHELVLDIGLKALKISEDWIIYRVMGCSSFQLERYKDAIKFFKQQLKLFVMHMNIYAYNCQSKNKFYVKILF